MTKIISINSFKLNSILVIIKIILISLSSHSQSLFKNIQWKTHTFTLNAIAFISIFASACIWADCINTFRIFMAWMHMGSAFINFGTIEFIDTSKPRQTIAYIRTNRVFAQRIQMAMITKLAALLCTFIYICGFSIHDDNQQKKGRNFNFTFILSCFAREIRKWFWYTIRLFS